jgi:hypothetical protein
VQDLTIRSLSLRASALTAWTWLLLCSACGTTAGPALAATDGAGAAEVVDTIAGSDSADVQQPADAVTDSVDGGACPEGSACDDGDKCTTGDQCKGGTCHGIPLVCTTSNPCEQSVCEPNNGVCLTSNKDGACDDGDPCTQADNCLLGVCTGFPKPGCCTVNCTGKVCGDDGCGGSCGVCKAGELCGNGACVASTAAGETCADALVIGALPFQHVGTTLGAQNDLNAPDKACYNGSLGTYGPDVVYRYTPPADGTIGITITGYSNKPAVYAASDCADIKNSCVGGALGFGQDVLGPTYVPVSQGVPLFIIVDADQDGGDYTLDISSCTPDCKGKQCGTDGCGGVCGYCAKLSAYDCSNIGTCVCVPSCKDKSCGGDGCGGSCGSCPSGQVCDGGIAGAYKLQCVQAGQAGDTCATAIAIDTSPYTFSGTTVGLGNNLYGWAFCPGDGTGAYYGAEAPDMVFSVGGKQAETWYVELTKASTSLEIYALTDCADPISCQQAGYKGFTLKTQLLVESPTGSPLYVAVDGYDDQSGTFTLQAKKCVLPGDCPEGEAGEYCSFPIVINGLPFQQGGSIGIDSYALPKGACGAKKQLGHGGGDRAYALTAGKSGTYTVTVQGSLGMDPIVYVAKDCTQLAKTCAGFVDKTGENGKEVLTFNATAGEVWFVVVDAPTSIGGKFDLGVTGP